MKKINDVRDLIEALVINNFDNRIVVWLVCQCARTSLQFTHGDEIEDYEDSTVAGGGEPKHLVELVENWCFGKATLTGIAKFFPVVSSAACRVGTYWEEPYLAALYAADMIVCNVIIENSNLPVSKENMLFYAKLSIDATAISHITYDNYDEFEEFEEKFLSGLTPNPLPKNLLKFQKYEKEIYEHLQFLVNLVEKYSISPQKKISWEEFVKNNNLCVNKICEKCI